MSKRALRRLNLAFGAAALIFVSPLVAPQLLAFPYHATSHGSEVWSEQPLPQSEIDAVMGRATALVSQSPIAEPRESRRIFLTDGGWRWTWLTLHNRGSLALSRAVGEPVIVNRSNLAADRIENVALGRTRTISGVIAHEMCHGMERRRYGAIKSDLMAPQWLREGYCDHVAQEGTLTDADVAALEAKGEEHPALPYYRGRKRVEALLANNGGDVDALFETYD